MSNLIIGSAFRGGGSNNKHFGFTLAEVLITLGIIGVVAAITMPVLMTNVQDRVKQKRVENIKQKLSKVTDKMAVQSGLTGYGDTMSFVREMNKHMKIAKICDNNHIGDCWPTKEVDLDKDGKMWEIAKTKNAKTLKISSDIADSWADTVGIVTADGTPIILSYKKDCDFDVDKSGLVFNKGSAMSNSMSCLSGVFDWNGGRKPNKLAKLEGNSKGDVLPFGQAKGLGNVCALEIEGVCFGTLFTPTPLTRVQCEEEVQKGTLGIKGCYWDSDYWAGAVKQCGGVKNMPTKAQLGRLATELYGTSIGANENVNLGLKLNTSKSASLGDTNSIFGIWSGEEGGSLGGAYYRAYSQTGTIGGYDGRSGDPVQAICIGG